MLLCRDKNKVKHIFIYHFIFYQIKIWSKCLFIIKLCCIYLKYFGDTCKNKYSNICNKGFDLSLQNGKIATSINKTKIIYINLGNRFDNLLEFILIHINTNFSRCILILQERLFFLGKINFVEIQYTELTINIYTHS